MLDILYLLPAADYTTRYRYLHTTRWYMISGGKRQTKVEIPLTKYQFHGKNAQYWSQNITYSRAKARSSGFPRQRQSLPRRGLYTQPVAARYIDGTDRLSILTSILIAIPYHFPPDAAIIVVPHSLPASRHGVAAIGRMRWAPNAHAR